MLNWIPEGSSLQPVGLPYLWMESWPPAPPVSVGAHDRAGFEVNAWCLQLGGDLDLIRRSLSDAQDTAGYDLSSDGDLRVLYRHVKGGR